MTIAISVKVHGGVVLAADSASTLVGTSPDGRTAVINVYNNANKVFNLYKGLPIAAMTWGSGSIGSASLATLAKDLRRRLMDGAPAHNDWKLDPRNYTIEAVAKAVSRFLLDQINLQAGPEPARPSLGLFVAGYSSGEDLSEVWRITVDHGECDEVSLLQGQTEPGITWGGDAEAVARLVFGSGTRLAGVLRELGVPDGQIEPALRHIVARLTVSLAPPPMPIQDAIDLAAFLVDTAIGFSRFSPGASTVGGPVDVAAITKHEGFKWVRRKYYYEAAYNPA